MAASGFSVTITAVDRATAVVAAVNNKLVALMAPITRLQAALAKFGDVSGLNTVARGLGNIVGFAASAAKSLLSVLGPLTAITSAVSIAGMTRMAEAWAGFAQRLGFDATRIGIAVDRLHALQGAARLAGASGDALTTGMRTLSDTLTDAVGGRNGEAVVMFRTLGVTFQNLDGTARSASDVLPDLADRIAAIRNPALQARAATAFFGGAAEALLPFLRRGAQGLREYEAEARKYGVITESGTRVAMAMREAQTKLGLAFEGLGNKISESVAPVLTDLFTFMSDWVLKHSAKILKVINGIASAFANWAKNGGLDRLLDAVERIATTIAGMTMPKWMQRYLGIDDSTAPAAKATGDVPFEYSSIGDMPDFATNYPSDRWKRQNARRGGNSLDSVPLAQSYKNDQASAIYQQLLGLGWTPAAAAGAVANMDAESGFDDRNVGDGGAAYGLGQWHPDRQANFRKMFGKSIQESTTGEQVKFFDWEARGGDAQFGSANVTGITNPAEAGDKISRFGERPGDVWGQAKYRSELAQSWYNRLVAGGPASAGPYGGAGGGGGAGGDRGGSVKVDVNLRGAPPGTTMTTTTAGDVRATGKVETAMPGAGGAP